MENPIRLHWLDPRDPRQQFPPPHLAMHEPNGLLALGGDLSVTRLLRAYSQGIFPWFNPDEPILWWCPDPRCVLRPQEFKTSRSLGRSLRKNNYGVTLNRAFDEVVRRCAAPRTQGRGTWLGGHMQRAYQELHQRGFCHSIEVWREQRLIGGLYGVSVGRAFFGESMFSAETDASKIALHWLCRQLDSWGFALIDCQITTPHLLSLGAQTVSRQRFLMDLKSAVAAGGRTGPWCFDIAAPAPRGHLPA